MAVVVLFRNLDSPFDKSLLPELDTLREIFAEQLDHVIRVHHRAEPNWPNEAPVDSYDEYDEFGGGGFEPYDEFDDYGDDLDLAA